MKRTTKIALAAGLISAFTLAAFPLGTLVREQILNRKAQTLLDGMTTEEKIGQVLLMNFRSWGTDAEGNPLPLEECNDTIRGIIGTYHLGNIILFGENVRDTEKAVRLVDDFQQSANQPLLIGIDQEGGIVTRLGQGTCLPGNMALGASGKAKNARLAGRLMGEELSAIGVNCNFAPVCDVNDNLQNPVIHLRSFSSDPNTVATMATALREGLGEAGMISAAKHFPGHGNTSVDTHVGLAVVNRSRTEWDAVEAVPFRTMIKDGVEMIMSAHIQYPQLDATTYRSQLSGKEVILPATLSHKILTDILRGELGFDGVV
ncbi:MAG: glycoside hydrolase family 3 N-terminal domain-containing protein, partial [Oscillospiraceae bacterium]